MSKEDATRQPPMAVGTVYSHAITVALAQHAVVLILAALVLDGGHMLRICTIAALASWLCTLVIMLRRRKQPTRFDLGLVRYGFWPAMFLVTTIEFAREFFLR